MPADPDPLESTAKGLAGGFRRAVRDHGRRALLRAALHAGLFFMGWLGVMALGSCLRGCCLVAEPVLEDLHKSKPVTTYEKGVTH